MSREREIVYGNYENKYSTRNPIARYLVLGFIRTFERILADLPTMPQQICEVGCGEGELLKHIHKIFPLANLTASDISATVIEEAKKNCNAFPVNFSVQDAEDLNQYEDGAFDLVVCCEVLEHLFNPDQGLHELWRISRKYVLVSVPNEPVWRILNLLRGKYIKDLGNTPGHLNHWTKTQFAFFLQSERFDIVWERYPFPWQMILLEKR